MDSELGILMLNYLADFWDMKERYTLLFNSTASVLPHSTPSCSVLIKHLPESNDVVFGHNSWFEYRAMGYRYEDGVKELEMSI